jgi:hypothetical protein
VPETAVCYFNGIAHAHPIKVERASRLARQTARFRSFEAVMASKRMVIPQRFQHPKKQENALACSNQTLRKSGLSLLKVERVNPLQFAQSVFVKFR